MLIADAQAHVWGPNTAARPWRAGQRPHWDVLLTPDVMLREMDAAGVTRAVIISPFWDGPRNDVVLEGARQYPNRFGVMGRLDNVPPPTAAMLPTWREQPGMLGLRCSISARQGNVTPETLAEVDWLWSAAEQANVPLMALVPHVMMLLIDAVAERYPRLRLALCNLGLTNGEKDEVAFRDLHKLLALARRPNVSVKVSGLPVYTNDDYPYHALHPYLRRVYDAFGPQRMFWGSDISRVPCSYRETVTMFTEEMPWLTNEDQEWIMGRGLCEWIGWEMPAAEGAQRLKNS